MNIYEFKKIMKILACTRPVFHSEADFQFSLAQTIHGYFQQKYNNALVDIRLEYPVSTGNSRNIYIDMMIKNKLNTFFIELKYKTKKASMPIIYNNEKYYLKNQSAYPGGRYDFLKDVERLIKAKSTGLIKAGFAIFLTNENKYFEKPNRVGKKTPDDINFRIHQGMKKMWKMSWRNQEPKVYVDKKPFTYTNSRLFPVDFENRLFICDWLFYSSFPQYRQKFKYLIFRV